MALLNAFFHGGRGDALFLAVAPVPSTVPRIPLVPNIYLANKQMSELMNALMGASGLLPSGQKPQG